MGASEDFTHDEAGDGIVFLVGMPRSGTTLLIEQLAKHPDILATPETHFFLSACRTRAMARKHLSVQDSEAVYAELFDRLRGPRADRRYAAGRRRFSSPTRLATVARLAFEDALCEANRRILIEKTPDHGFFIDAITAVFPSARFVFLIRDPRDVALSWMKAPWNPAGLLWPGLKWKAMLRHVSRRMAGSDQTIFWVRYEDLIANPKSELLRILEFLRLDGARLERANFATVTFDPAIEYWKARATEPIDANNTQRWRTDMFPVYQFLFDRLIGDDLDRYGYPRAGISFKSAGPSRVARATAYECYLLASRIPMALARRLRLARQSFRKGA